LVGADLNDASLYLSDLRGAHLNGAYLRNADVGGANASKADLSGADIRWANISEADFSESNLKDALLAGSNLTETNFAGANLSGCSVYAISAWNLKIDAKTKQSNLIVTKSDEPKVTVDSLEVAQFVYLLLNRRKLRDVLGAITSKAVLLLGRFTPERKAILDALANALRRAGLVPIIFDFERASSRDFTETIKILAGLSLFVIVDITRPKSVPQELTAVVPDYQIPFVPIIQHGEKPYSMFENFKKYKWVLQPVLAYQTRRELLANFENLILAPAWAKHIALQREKNATLEVMSIGEMKRHNKSPR
jgi:hypothetical protein